MRTKGTLIGAGVAAMALILAACGGTTVANELSQPARAAAATSGPSQQQALDANATARAYIESHPDIQPTLPPPTIVPSTSVAPTTTSASPPPAGRYASGLPWSDGGWFENDGAQANNFAAWRGRHVDNINVYNDRDTWPSMLDQAWKSGIPTSFVPSTDDLLISIPMWANNGSVTNIGTDAQWKQLAQQIAAVDSNAIVRLGWEMNCCYSGAMNANAAQWKADWTKEVTNMRSVAPNLKFAFNPNEGVSGNGFISDPSTLFIPGQMDMILLDAYDWYPPYNTASNAQQHQAKTFGWDWWYNFAQSKAVPFGLGEWSVAHIGSNGGNDDPAFINFVYNWLAAKNTAKPGSIRIASLFNWTDPGIQHALFPTNFNPNSAAAYKAQIARLAS